MTWNIGPSRGARRNQRIRASWGSQGRRESEQQYVTSRREMGHGTWGGQERRLIRRWRRNERRTRRGKTLRGFFATMVTGTVILSVLLLISSATRPAGMMILFVVVTLYVITRRKKA